MPPGVRLLVDRRRAHGLGEYSPPIHWHRPPGIDIRVLVDLEPGGHRFQVLGDCQVFPPVGWTGAPLGYELAQCGDDFRLAFSRHDEIVPEVGCRRDAPTLMPLLLHR